MNILLNSVDSLIEIIIFFLSGWHTRSNPMLFSANNPLLCSFLYEMSNFKANPDIREGFQRCIFEARGFLLRSFEFSWLKYFFSDY